MQTALPTLNLDRYTSKSQRARVATEAWGLENLFCPNCESPSLQDLPANTKSIDYRCGSCKSEFQLKSQSKFLSGRIVDAAYGAMIRAIQEDRTPNLFALEYDAAGWNVKNLILIPHFAFPLSAIEKRKPLSPTARRAGWVGCNILLSAIPVDARIPIIADGQENSARDVRAQFEKIRPLEKLKSKQRGWTLEVLNLVRSFGKPEFSLEELYSKQNELAALHPNNHNVGPKIRQQLQVLRDLGLLVFLGGSEYRLR
jgi:type II restriction enzyme